MLHQLLFAALVATVFVGPDPSWTGKLKAVLTEPVQMASLLEANRVSEAALD